MGGQLSAAVAAVTAVGRTAGWAEAEKEKEIKRKIYSETESTPVYMTARFSSKRLIQSK